MSPTNSPEEIEFFQTIARGDVERLRHIVRDNPKLLDAFDYRNFGATPLTAVCFNNRPTLVETLLELGADPNRKSDWPMGPWSPLHCAIFRRNTALAELLLASGATMDVHTAAGLGKSQDVSQLLDENPSRVLEPGGDGCHPLHFADTIEVAQLLLDRGANIDARCLDHYSTPVQYLCSIRPEVANFLFSQGATPDIFSAALCGNSALLASLLDADPGLISARINQTFFPPSKHHDVHNILTFSIGQNSTPLHAAAQGNHPIAITLLVERGFLPNVRGGYDDATPLHTAAWHNRSEPARALIELGADINARSGKIHNNSPAGWAIVAGSANVFELLIEKGAECYPWFLDDARDACAGRFDQVTQASPESRQRILKLLEQQTKS